MQKVLVVILGPTASGKSSLGVSLAKKFNGEVISADSRQVYTGLDIGSGKVTVVQRRMVPHHLLDIASPKLRFTVSQYQNHAFRAIHDIQNRGKLPFLIGGSPLYIFAVTDGWQIPEVKPNALLRKKLEKLSTDQLLARIAFLDPRRAANIEQKNRRRLIRALEIVLTTKKPVPALVKHLLPYPILFMGIQKSNEELKALIQKRLIKRLRQGMIKEVEGLRKSGVSFRRLEEFGLEYKFISLFLQKKMAKKEMIEKLQYAIFHFSRRQMTWFKRDSRIQWIRTQAQAEKQIRSFLTQLQ